MFDGRLQAGRQLRLEYCPVHVLERSAGRVLTVAVWHEDVHDPGDATLVYVELARTAAGLTVRCSFDREHLDSGWRVTLTQRR